MSLIYNATFDKNTRKLSFEDKAGNEIYSFTVPERAPVDDITKPLTFKSTQYGSTVKLIQNEGTIDVEFQTSRDGGNTWADYTLNTVITLNIGDKVSFRAKADRSIQTTSGYFQFEMTGKIEAWHNVTSLYRPNDFATNPLIGSSWFYMLFKDCKSLIKAPVLPSTYLSGGCYESMFWGCTSLTEAPALPATILAYGCYRNMFYGCKSLTKSPELMATELNDNCYVGMFRECSSLDEVRCKVPSSYGGDILRYTEGTGPGPLKNPWLDGVSSTGTFYTNSDAYWPSGANGIPDGWRRVNE